MKSLSQSDSIKSYGLVILNILNVSVSYARPCGSAELVSTIEECAQSNGCKLASRFPPSRPMFLIKHELILRESYRVHADVDISECILRNSDLAPPNRHPCHPVSTQSHPPSLRCTMTMRLVQPLSQTHQRRVPHLR